MNADIQQDAEFQYLPLSETMEELSTEDMEIVARKIGPLEKMPFYIQIFLLGFLVIVTLMVWLIGGLSWIYGLFVLSVLGMMLLVKRVLRGHLEKLKRDVLGRRKRVWRGTLMDAFRKYDSKGRNTNSRKHVWKVSGREFVLEEESDFLRAKVGDLVEIEQLPESELILRVMKAAE